MGDQSKCIDWIHILNEQTVWVSNQDIDAWFAKVTGENGDLSETTITAFNETLNDMRSVLSALHFDRRFDLSALQRRVEAVRMSFLPEQGQLPLFRACPHDDSRDSLLIATGQTALMQFCTYISEVLSGRKLDLFRCEGVFRDVAMNTISQVRGLDADQEIEWRCEIPILVDSNLQQSTEVHRCADYFLGGKGKFCSDACRFATFQLMKQLQDPDYLAEKQRRYRAKKR